MSQVVVLNASFEPLGVVTTKRALLYLVRERATVIEAVPGRVVRSENRELPVPRVVQFRSYIRVPFRFREAPWSRRRMLERDGHECAYCGRHAMTVDHIVPQSRGGRSTWLNTIAACVPCNGRKGSRTPEEAGMVMRYRPTVISTHDMLVIALEQTGADLDALGLRPHRVHERAHETTGNCEPRETGETRVTRKAHEFVVAA